jgi:hypothetical protein
MKNNYNKQMGGIQYPLPKCPENPKYAHAYVPYQTLSTVYSPSVGLCKGTIFPELDAPYGTDPEYTVDA